MALRVVFCVYGAESYFREAAMMVETCKWHGYEVWQLTDDQSPEVPNVDKVLRREKNEPQVLWRYNFLASLEGDYLSLDVDVLVRNDVSRIADNAYDVVLTERGNTGGMIYNGGVFYVHNNEFIRECADMISAMPPEWQDWTGGQRAMAKIAPGYRFKSLSCDQWNYSPQGLDDAKRNVHILHFKGNKRREMMPVMYEFLDSRRKGTMG